MNDHEGFVILETIYKSLHVGSYGYLYKCVISQGQLDTHLNRGKTSAAAQACETRVTEVTSSAPSAQVTTQNLLHIL